MQKSSAINTQFSKQSWTHQLGPDHQHYWQTWNLKPQSFLVLDLQVFQFPFETDHADYADVLLKWKINKDIDKYYGFWCCNRLKRTRLD